MEEKKLKDAVKKIADNINYKRRQELIQVFSHNSTFLEYLAKLRNQKMGNRFGRRRDDSMQRVASVPLEVDRFFTKVYGRDYYKDPLFFDKYYPEWKV